ncbi:helix-turn-helix domain-containing protein [Streptomyces carpinensis]|uniref:helix-turn-helix domain-containing protein n=1 Tax=Streptomyces carpinensis TaxID=66369 RepID=UPI000A39B58D|nr:helix-turn-helix transcriptional regulator [Streptomyces carpinensis]
MSNQAPNPARVIPLRPPAARPENSRQTPARPALARPASAHPVVERPVTGRPADRSAPTAPREPLWRDLVGDVLRRQRLAQERTLKDVAEAARISMPYLSEIERGRKEASSEVLAAAAQALGLGLGDLLSLAQGELVRLTSRTAGRGRATSTSRIDGLCLAA